MRAPLTLIATLTVVLGGVVSLGGAARAASNPGSPALQMFTEQLPIPPQIDARAGGSFVLDELVGTHVFGNSSTGLPLPPTPSFGYWPAGLAAPDNVSFPYLGPTIEAQRGRPISMTVTNRLARPGADLRAPQACQAAGLTVIHPLAPFFDLTIAGADELNECAPATATHLHGGHTPAASDGTPMDVYRAQVAGDVSDYSGGTGAFTYEYPNDQEATTLWYHDHAFADTRFNPMAGLAAFYLVRDQWDTGRADNKLGLPSNDVFQTLGYDHGLPILQPVNPSEIPLVLQDRRFHPDGTLSYDTASTNFHPVWAPESFGDVAVVNGKAWPNLNVDRGLYRFRLLNGSNARFYRLSLVDAKTGNVSRIPIYVIGSDGGLLNEPVPVDSLPGGKILIAPGERYDLLVDFRAAASGSTYRLMNNAPAPFPKGRNDLKAIMQFTVGSRVGFTGDVPTVLRGRGDRPEAVPAPARSAAAATRTMFLNETMDPGTDEPVAVLLNNLMFADSSGAMRATGIERPAVNTTEVWTIVNTTGDAHPIHLHATQFQLVDRQAIDAGGYLAAVNPLLPDAGVLGTGVQGSEGALPPPDPAPFLRGRPKAPDTSEAGWKDTVKVYPGEVVRLLVPFGGTAAGLAAAFTGDSANAAVQRFAGMYVWHCHILEHEENDMMQPYAIE